MALRIRLESKGVAGANLWGHLYLVLWDDALPYQDAYNSALVIRGGPLGSDLSIESDGFLLRDSIDRYDSGTPASERPQIDITDLIPGGSLGWAKAFLSAIALEALVIYWLLVLILVVG